MNTAKNSGILDKNGTEIKDGDIVMLEIKILNQTKPLSFINQVKFLRGAFRLVGEIGDTNMQPCISDLSYNCTLEIINTCTNKNNNYNVRN
jgi:hypothetical protein